MKLFTPDPVLWQPRKRRFIPSYAAPSGNPPQFIYGSADDTYRGSLDPITFLMPTVQAGDGIIIMVVTYSPTATVTPPSASFVELPNSPSVCAVGGTTLRSHFYRYRCSGTESGSYYSFDITNDGWINGILLQYRGIVDADNFVDVTDNTNTAVQQNYPPDVQVTTTVDNTKLVWIGNSGDDFDTELSAVTPTGFTKRLMSNWADNSTQVADMTKAVAGDSGAVNVGTPSWPNWWNAFLLALKPPHVSYIVGQGTFKTNGSGVATMTVDKPTGVVDGDILVAISGQEYGPASGLTASGWNEVALYDYDTNVHAKVWMKVASGEGATFNFGKTSAGCDGWVGVCAIRGDFDTDYTHWTKNANIAAYGGTPIRTCPSLSANGGVLLCGVSAHSNGTTKTFTPPGTMNELLDATGDAYICGTIAEQQDPANPTGTKDFTISSETSFVGSINISILVPTI